MHPVFASAGKMQAVPILFVTAANFAEATRILDDRAHVFIRATGYEPKPGRHLIVPGPDGKLAAVLFGLETDDEPVKDLFRPGQLVGLLPPGTYRFANAPHNARLAALAFALGAYQFTRYRKVDTRNVRLVLPDGVDGEDLTHIAEAVTLCRDLINTPSNDMGPAELEAAARALAKQHSAKVQVTSGDALVKNFPLDPCRRGRLGARATPHRRHLGQGQRSEDHADRQRGLFRYRWSRYQTRHRHAEYEEGYGGAATALALAHMIMARGLNLRLRVLIPAVENSISATSFRPRDVYVSRKGISVEIGNTDAEGRLILADALALADEDKPSLIVDFATLTGAARVALGPEVPPFFTDDDALADELMRAGGAENDPVWRMPLWRPYEVMLDSKVADLNNIGTSGHGGAIIAALFLRRFVTAPSWLHLDIFAWTPSAKPGRPEGAECQTARALYAMLSARYS